MIIILCCVDFSESIKAVYQRIVMMPLITTSYNKYMASVVITALHVNV